MAVHYLQFRCGQRPLARPHAPGRLQRAHPSGWIPGQYGNLHLIYLAVTIVTSPCAGSGAAELSAAGELPLQVWQ